MDAGALQATVDRFNGFARTGIDQDFGRGNSAYDRYYSDPSCRPNPNMGTLENSLATCQGELVNAPLQVTITDAAGKSLVDETVTTHANGFYGFWLPRDITGTLTVRADGRSATVPIGTGPDDPTCLTTVKLS